MFQTLTAFALVAGLTTTTSALLTCPNFTAPFLPPSTRKNIIIDTDLLSFTDDVAAVAVANTLQSMGYANILGIVSDVASEYSPPAIDAIDTWYCHPSIPLAQKSPTTKEVREPDVPDNVTEYITQLSNRTRFPQHFNRSNVKDPVKFYTDVLNNASDNSVTIVAIGFLTNLYNLYNSTGGPDLIKKKVKELVVQGGSCNTTDHPYSAGYNLVNDLSAAMIVTKWPSIVTFLPGFEAKKVTGVKAGLNLPKTNPVGFVYQTANFSTDAYRFPPHDILTTYYAVFGLKDGSFIYGNANQKGGLQFVPKSSASSLKTNTVWNNSITPDKAQRYLILNQTPQSIAGKMNALISCYGTKQPDCSGQK